MKCYKDMTFCAAHCMNYECDRHQSYVPDELPKDTDVSWADFSEYCDYYMPDSVGVNNNG